MPNLADFTPLGHSDRVVCRDAEVARQAGHPGLDYPKQLSDGSAPSSYREYEMWMLGRKYAHALHAGTLVDEEAMIEAKKEADAARARVLGWHRDRCWHADNQRAFLEILAGGGSVTEACQVVGLSKQSAYRHRVRDERFRLGWEAALLLGQPRILEEFVERARTGQTETWTRVAPDGGTTYVTRKRYDNVHAIRILDHFARAAAAPSADDKRARAVADDFDAWLAGIATVVEDEPEVGAPPVEEGIEPMPELPVATPAPVDERLTVASQPDATRPAVTASTPSSSPAPAFDHSRGRAGRLCAVG